jgi:hypothetical protein
MSVGVGIDAHARRDAVGIGRAIRKPHGAVGIGKAEMEHVGCPASYHAASIYGVGTDPMLWLVTNRLVSCPRPFCKGFRRGHSPVLLNFACKPF